MTKEEAIKILKSMSDISTQGEAIDMAIEALSAQQTDLISRADAIEALRGLFDMRKSRAKVIVECFGELLNALPSADAVPLCDDCTKCTVKALNRPSAESEDRLYIKIYADDEPSVKAEKLYQICGETQNREVTKWLKEYFPSADAVQGDECDHCVYKWGTKGGDDE